MGQWPDLLRSDHQEHTSSEFEWVGAVGRVDLEVVRPAVVDAKRLRCDSKASIATSTNWRSRYPTTVRPEVFRATIRDIKGFADSL
jgi:hypothetical protein